MGTTTASVDYTVVAGDNADGVAVGAVAQGMTSVTVNFSCTPAG